MTLAFRWPADLPEAEAVDRLHAHMDVPSLWGVGTVEADPVARVFRYSLPDDSLARWENLARRAETLGWEVVAP